MCANVIQLVSPIWNEVLLLLEKFHALFKFLFFLFFYSRFMQFLHRGFVNWNIIQRFIHLSISHIENFIKLLLALCAFWQTVSSCRLIRIRFKIIFVRNNTVTRLQLGNWTDLAFKCVEPLQHFSVLRFKSFNLKFQLVSNY